MSDAVLVALIVAVPAALVAVGTWWNTRITVKAAAKVATAKLGEIHDVVNSKMTDALRKIDVLEGENRSLRDAAAMPKKKPGKGKVTK